MGCDSTIFVSLLSLIAPQRRLREDEVVVVSGKGCEMFGLFRFDGEGELQDLGAPKREVR